MEKKRYPIGVQTFEKIIDTGCVYVDKTAIVHHLAHDGSFFFLSRPRRFGKSLLCSTLQAYFEGRRELFRGLAMERLEQDWTVYPVLRIDLSTGNYATLDGLREKLANVLRTLEEKFGMEQDGDAGLRLESLIRHASARTGQKVVVLIDEYDKPMLEALEQGEAYDDFQKTMQTFYGALKASDEYIRFCLLTGISKFGKLSVFSALNNLRDISMSDKYADICGITEAELHEYFDDDIRELARENGLGYEAACEQLRSRYDGYHFSPQSPGMYNPFSLLNTFSDRQIRNYWFATGTPTFLMSLLKRSNFDLEKLDGDILASEGTLWNINSGNDAIPALYQSGYLTLKDYDADGNMFTLGFPNDEVAGGFRHFLLPYYSGQSSSQMDGELYRMRLDVKRGDVESFMERLKATLAGTPMENSRYVELTYRNMLYLVFHLLGFRASVEQPTSNGRIDLTLETPDYVYLFEFKLNQDVEKARRQLVSKHYADRYATDPRRVVRIAASFSDELKNIEAWEIV